MFPRLQTKSVSLLKTHLPHEEVKGHRTVTRVPVRKACLFIINASRETLNCIFHIRAAGMMMAPHSKLNQTCIAKHKRQHDATTPRLLCPPIG